MEKTLEIQLQELREQIALDIESKKYKYDPYSELGILSASICDDIVSTIRGEHK